MLIECLLYARHLIKSLLALKATLMRYMHYSSGFTGEAFEGWRIFSGQEVFELGGTPRSA